MAGIYIHIPFCKQKCSYCDFHFSTTYGSYRDEMITSILSELEQRVDYLEGKSIETIYFGGGTPSLLREEELNQLIEFIKEHYAVIDRPEITLEANPDDIDEENLAVWKEAGVNRLSIGLQSFRPQDLKWMNRAHAVEDALKCVPLAQSFGFTNLTVDLIYGLPDMSLEEWCSNVDQVIAFGVPHVSAYCLTVEDKTALNNWVKRGKIKPAEEEQQSDEFELLIQRLEEAGLQQYEISNFAKKGFESRHNSNYWKGQWYLGVGPSAHSYNGHSRQWNIASNQGYMKAIAGGDAYAEVESLSREDQFNEYILTGLRTIYGVDLKRLNQLIALNDQFMKQCQDFIESGWMDRKNDTLKLTREGRIRADFIASELFMVS